MEVTARAGRRRGILWPWMWSWSFMDPDFLLGVTSATRGAGPTRSHSCVEASSAFGSASSSRGSRPPRAWAAARERLSGRGTQRRHVPCFTGIVERARGMREQLVDRGPAEPATGFLTPARRSARLAERVYVSCTGGSGRLERRACELLVALLRVRPVNRPRHSRSVPSTGSRCASRLRTPTHASTCAGGSPPSAGRGVGAGTRWLFAPTLRAVARMTAPTCGAPHPTIRSLWVRKCVLSVSMLGF